MYKLMVVEDDPGIAQAVRERLESWDFQVHTAHDFRRVMEEFDQFGPQLVLLDISLPFYNGYHWCAEIRRCSQVPIIFLSSAADNMNIVMAMNTGADDFIAKPFDLDVLVAKVQALLRRSYDFGGLSPQLEHMGASLDAEAQVLRYNGESLDLTKNEYRILLCLMENRGRVVSREKLMERLWATEQFVDENTLTVNVNRLRKKLAGLGLEGFITTKVGEGYRVG